MAATILLKKWLILLCAVISIIIFGVFIAPVINSHLPWMKHFIQQSELYDIDTGALWYTDLNPHLLTRPLSDKKEKTE
jgi:hypothetical protein